MAELAYRLVVERDHRPRGGTAPRERTDITWPGDGTAAVGWLRGLRAEWPAVLERLTEADLDGIAPFPWAGTPSTPWPTWSPG